MVAITPLPSHEADLAADQPAAAAPPGVATVPELQWCPLCTESVQNLVHCSGCKAGSCLPCLKQWLSCDISKVCPFCRLESVELDEAWAQPEIDAVLAGPREHSLLQVQGRVVPAMPEAVAELRHIEGMPILPSGICRVGRSMGTTSDRRGASWTKGALGIRIPLSMAE